MRLYSDDPPDDPCDRPEDWESGCDLPAEASPMSESEVRRVAAILGLDLDEPGAWWADPLEMGDLSEPFDEAAE